MNMYAKVRQWLKKFTWDESEETDQMLGFIDNSLKIAEEYNNLKNSDRLIVLPSKDAYTHAGDTAYFIYDQELVEVIYGGAEINYKGEVVVTLFASDRVFETRQPDSEHDTDPTDWCENFIERPISEIDKTIFFDITKAKRALKVLSKN